MHIFASSETHQDPRAALTPATAEKLIKNAFQVSVEQGLGAQCFFSDEDYRKVGVSVVSSNDAKTFSADIYLRVTPPSPSDIEQMKEGALALGFLDPLNNKETIELFLAKNITAVSLELIPRTTLAQKMDALSSQASLGGYVAVMMIAQRLKKIFPMMMTPAGTISPARVFIIGAGVAGLQAIATARRLGARVEAFDTRPVVAEQVRSLGAKFVKIDIGETQETKNGYAKALTEEQIEKQRQGMAKICAQVDAVITTAQVFGKKAPIIVTKDMIKGMKPGSVIVDMAVETGGNVEGAKAGEIIDLDGVSIVGLRNLPGYVAADASRMLSSNFTHFLIHFWDKETKNLTINLEDEILKNALVCHKGKTVSALIKERLKI